MKITSTSNTKDLKHNIAIIGPSKTGKTFLVSTIKEKALLCNADKGALTLKDSKIDKVDINSYEDFIEFMKFVTKSKEFEKRGYKWVIFDSVSTIGELVKKHLDEKGITGFDFWGEYLKVMAGLMAETRDTARFNSLSIYEVSEKENSNSLLEKKFGVEGSIRDKAPYFYDLILATKRYTKDKKTMYALQSNNKDGYNFLGGRNADKLNDLEPSNIPHILKKVMS